MSLTQRKIISERAAEPVGALATAKRVVGLCGE
jgi:hypothetical protein